MARRLIPLLDRVLIERIIAPTKSAGGVLLPETAVPKVRVTRLAFGCHSMPLLAQS
jgi:chaperonin GroES